MSDAELGRIRSLVAANAIRLTQHAHEEMVEESIQLNEVLEVIANAQIIENYPEHKRGPCCLLAGATRTGRNLHVVCTTECPVLIVITVYEPGLPKWETPTQRRKQS
jgi:hypothetical protein